MDEDSITDDDNLEEENLDSDSTGEQTGDDTDNLETSESDDDSETEENDDSDEADGDNSGASDEELEIDPDLDEWAEKTKRPVPTTDAERMLLQEIRNGQREYSRAHQGKETATKLKDGIAAAKPEGEQDNSDDGDPLAKRQDRLEADLAEERALRQRGEYLNQNEVSDDEVTAMGEILKEKVDKAPTAKAKREAFDYWTNPTHLEDWHDLARIRLAKAGDSGDDRATIEAEAARKERVRLAKESRANGSNRNAASTRTGEKTEDEKRLERFQKWD